jgi:N6-L-threonylcarbamoyladenine synthase
VDIHARYGGIVPEVASRQHLLTIIPVAEKAMAEAGITLKQIDAIAATVGPGLAGSLIVGVNFARAISQAEDLPFRHQSRRGILCQLAFRVGRSCPSA